MYFVILRQEHNALKSIVEHTVLILNPILLISLVLYIIHNEKYKKMQLIKRSCI